MEGAVLDPTSPLGTVLSYPGHAMTRGDVAIRRILQAAGFPEREARIMTLTSEPEAKGFRSFANFGKGEEHPVYNMLFNMLFPFKRTPANIAEGSIQRAPGLGLAIQAFRDKPDPIKQQLAQQGMGIGIGLGNYELGKNLDPETAKRVRRYSTNLAGRYGGIAATGFAAGQMAGRGKPAGPAAVARGLSEAFPFPTTESLQDWGTLGYNALTGGDLELPRGAAPKLLTDIFNPPSPVLNKPANIVLPRLSTIRNR